MHIIIVAVMLSLLVGVVDAFSKNALQMAPINPKFVEAISKNQKTSSAFNGQERALGLKISPHDPASRKIKPVEMKSKTIYGVLPSSYDLRTYGRVTSVKDQGAYGNCWAFASIASMESCLLPAETNDFSENNLSNLHGFDSAFGDGGNCYMSMAYFARWDGPVNESQDPYPNSGGSPTGLPVRKHLQEAIMLPDKTSAADIDVLKENLIKYGAFYTCIRWDSSFYNAGAYAFYNPSSDDPNHAVTIVGWDDNFNNNQFYPVPPGKGAFLVKNSWGTMWGNAGYFWVSYYDRWIGTENCIFNGSEHTNNYKIIYEHDKLGWCTAYGYGNNTAWGANIFGVSSDTGTIYAVSFYTVVPNVSCLIKIYNNVSETNPVSGSLALTQTTNYTFAGYHTVRLQSPVNVQNRFSVVIRFITPSYNYPVAVEYPISGYSSDVTASPGESFISYDGTSWTDCGAQSPAFNVCIKAFGTGSTSNPPTPATYIPLLNDFDADRYGDPALYYAAQGKLYVLASSYNLAKVFVLSGWGGNNYKPFAGIFDNDWFEDPMLYYPSAGYWYFLSSQSGYSQLYYTQWGDITYRPVAADFNGDWYVDPTVYKDGNWFILLSDGRPLVNGYNSWTYGYFYAAGASPFAGDVDGDGFADLILHHPSTGSWYALLSSSAYTQYVGAQWGGTGVSACVGDFDGDLKADLVVFNNTSGQWRALLSSYGYSYEVSGIWKP